MTSEARWQFWIDRGGTFTDIVARSGDGQLHARKLLSENPEVYSDAAIAGIRDLLGTPPDEPIDHAQISSVKMGTTVATNALLERRGAKTLFLTTEGFADVLEIGTQARPDIFAHKIEKPSMLYEAVAEIPERVLADGTIEQSLDEDVAREVLTAYRQEGFDAVAICLLHGFAFHEHERAVARIARSLGYTQVSVSHEVSPLVKMVNRGDTTVADAYLSPVLRHYVDQVACELDRTSLFFMTSSGGLTSADFFQGKDAILSGPAGGIVGLAETARQAGIEKVIGFDMGGTSTDVSHYAGGAYERTYETEVAGVRLFVPMLQIHTVAAGGGSLLTYDGSRYRVAPDSAGANPGPKCYRRGGPLTVTDANVMVGKLVPDHFPKIFGANADEPLDRDSVVSAFKALSLEIDDGRCPEEVADGFLQIGVQNMARAIKKITVERGIDVSDYTLSAFGGAGGQHACLVADCLGVRRVLIHPQSGLLSAYGIGLARLRRLERNMIECPLDCGDLSPVSQTIESLSQRNTEALLSQGVSQSEVSHNVELLIGYEGTDTLLNVTLSDLDAAQLRDAFETLHVQRFGFATPEKKVVIESVLVESVGGGSVADDPLLVEEHTVPRAHQEGAFFSQGAWHEANIYLRSDLKPGHRFSGPALIIENHQTVVVEPGWGARVSAQDYLLLERLDEDRQQSRAVSHEVDPVMLEVFNNLFMSIAEQMGEALKNTAQSVNIKERLDFSCGVFDGAGGLVANAPHVPVHLGSMDRSVETVIDVFKGDMKPGDVFMLNAPYNGGTHLPDITVVSPVFDADGDAILFYVASRGHHADVGGIAPGSMSPFATTIEEEGVYIEPTRLVSVERFLEDDVRDLFSSARYPARNVEQNLSDLKAQVAANKQGAFELQKICDRYGADCVSAYMGFVQDNGEESVRRAISVLSDCAFTVRMDQGTQVSVSIKVDANARSATVDFIGTSAQQANNFNAPEPVTRAAVLYVFRTLVGDNIPLNSGCLRPLTIRVPEGSLLSPRHPAAVVAGNVETSQVVTNCLFGALGVLGSSQGTMNNLTFGNERHQYYETICSGSPAGPDFHGCAAVQTHMTNSRLTDPEVLERRFPVVLERFKIREGSGGKGKWSAGDGTERIIRFLEEMNCSILSGFRRERPFGVQGGEPGEVGKNVVRRADGAMEPLKGCDQTLMQEGDAILIQTPTGGGFGKRDA